MTIITGDDEKLKVGLSSIIAAAAAAAATASQPTTLSPASTPAASSGSIGVGPVDYLTADSSAAAAAVVAAAAYGNLNSMYPGASYAPSASTDPALTSYIGHTSTYHHQTLYPTTALDNRYLTATENLFQYRPLGSYYPDYHTSTGYNGFIDVSLPPTYESHQQLAATADSPKYGGYTDTSVNRTSYVVGSPVPNVGIPAASTGPMLGRTNILLRDTIGSIINLLRKSGF